ncbi:hypothetical protein NP493_589g02003 [Ridgeia piscesae]|uniref:Protein SYS1 homolog n=1 Tax=Ridgeia piscesae TaxID=27915 RepID=A0AAD9NR29_RIDPI|nr:hypothetical protein NP493_589g02003 [Ridgeia piscesae]
MPGQFRSYVWDPVLIIGQILSMQSAFYLGLGLWIVVVDYILASHRSLDQVFSYEDLQTRDVKGSLTMVTYALNALSCSVGLWYVVRRTKQCWDFAMTMHFFHLLACWAFNHHLPHSLSWWLINIVSIIITTVCGEFLCMRTEMKAIPLSMGPKADL